MKDNVVRNKFYLFALRIIKSRRDGILLTVGFIPRRKQSAHIRCKSRRDLPPKTAHADKRGLM